MRRAKIVCTLGPATADPSTLDALVAAGLDCARLNFSHGTHAAHAEAAARVRAAAARAGRPVALLADLCGPKMRVGRFPGGPVTLAPGQPFTLSTLDRPGDAHGVGVSYPALAADARVGDAILLDDGLLRLRVTAIAGPEVHCTVEVGGVLRDKKGLNIPGTPLSTPALTAQDELDLAFAVHTLGVDYLALSFVRHPDDVRAAQALAAGTPVIAKIEKPEAIAHLDAILDAADGAMVARGDLGVELGAEKVPLFQKRIIRACNARGKLVITATQMLESMIASPVPTRAEAADVANAVLDGSDALMLSGETAVGAHPVAAVAMMDKIVREVEASWLAERRDLVDHEARLGLDASWAFADAAAKAAAVLSFARPLAALAVFTRDGRTARMLSEYRPRAPIFALTGGERAASALALAWGVAPRVALPPDTLPETLALASALLAREGLAAPGDELALVTGWPASGGTNTVTLHRVP